MRSTVWSNGAVGGGFRWRGGKDDVDIEEYNVISGGATSVCCGEIMFVMDRLGLRLSHATSENNGVN